MKKRHNTSIAAMGLVLFLALSVSASEAKLGLRRDIYGVINRGMEDRNTEGFPYINGQIFTSGWEIVNPAPDTYDWTELDARLQFAYEQHQPVMVRVLPMALQWSVPPWLEDGGVHLTTDGTYIYGDYLDPYYQTSFSNMVVALANHLRYEIEPHLRDTVQMVRVVCGATADPLPYNNGLAPANIPEEDWYTHEEWDNFRLWAWNVFIQALQGGSGDPIPLRFMVNPDNEVLWSFLEENLPDGFGVKYYAGGRGYHLTNSKDLEIEFGDKTINSDYGLFAVTELDPSYNQPYFQPSIPLTMYWTAAEALQAGLSCWDITGDFFSFNQTGNSTNDSTFAMEFFNKWAAELIPATAGGGYCIMHEGLDSSDTYKFPPAIYGEAARSNSNRYENICNDPVYAARGAHMDDPAGATLMYVDQRIGGLTGLNDSGWSIYPGNFERFITQIDPDGTSIGLFRINGPITAYSSPYDRFARSFEHASGKDTLYFDVNDDLVDSVSQRIQLSVIYLDRGTGSFELQYNAVGNSEKTAFVVNKTNSNVWKTNSVAVTDARFGNFGPNGADLMLLNLDADDDIFHMLELAKVSDVYVGSAGGGTVTARNGMTRYASASGTYMEGSRLELTAVPEPGWEFSRWSGDVTQTNGNWARLYPLEVSEVTAHFVFNGHFFSSDDFQSKSWSGGTGWSGDWAVSGGAESWDYVESSMIRLTSNGQMTRTLAQAVSNATLSFLWDADSLEPGESAQADVYDGSAWQTVWTVENADNGDDGAGPDALVREQLDLGAFGQVSQLRFKLNAPGGVDIIYIDNIQIEGYDASVVNRAPTFTSDPIVRSNAVQNSSFSGTLALDANDPDSDSLTFSKLAGPAWLSVATNGVMTGTPSVTDTGLNAFTVKVDDGEDGSDTATLLIPVQALYPGAPAAPIGLAAVSGADTISLDWLDNLEGDISGYNVYRSTSSGTYGSTPLAEDVSSSSYADNHIIPGMTYYYLVTAVDADGNESVVSEEVLGEVESQAFYAEDFTPAPAAESSSVLEVPVGTDTLGWYVNDDAVFADGVMHLVPFNSASFSGARQAAVFVSLNGAAAGDYTVSFDVSQFTAGGNYGTASAPDNTFQLVLLSGMSTVASGNSATFDASANATRANAQISTVGTSTQTTEDEFAIAADGSFEAAFTLGSAGTSSDVLALVWMRNEYTTSTDSDGFGDAFDVDNVSIQAVPGFANWAVRFGGTALIGQGTDDYDHDGVSNLGEYVLNGNPTNANDTGLVYIRANNQLCTVVYAANTVDKSLTYTLLDRTNLLSGLVRTNQWDIQTIGPTVDSYTTVSNHYDAAEKDQLFILLKVRRE